MAAVIFREENMKKGGKKINEKLNLIRSNI
jgi:hypothetical protein